MSNMSIKEIKRSDEAWLREFFIKHWGSAQMVYSQGIYDLDQLPGFAAYIDDRIAGVITYSQKENNELEIISLDSLEEGKGVGTALIHSIEAKSIQLSIHRIWLITTNDNLHALRFYQKRGYDLAKIYPNAVEKARRIKPEIPLIGNDGIEIKHEIELEKMLAVN